MSIQHSQILSADSHEPKHITDATTADTGKVLTPSSSIDHVSELRLLVISEISGLVAALAAKASLTGAETLTSKRVPPRIIALTDAATILVNADSTDVANVTITANRTLGNPSGTPTDGQKLWVRVLQDGTGGWTLAYDTKYRWSAGAAPTVTATASKMTHLMFEYVAAADKWDGLVIGLNY